MSEAPIKPGLDVGETLRRIRTVIQEGWRERTDPRKTFAKIAPQIAAMDSEVSRVRSFAPGLGEMWDTLSSLWGMCIDMHDMLEESAYDDDSTGVCPPVLDDDSDQDEPGGIAS